MSRIARYAVFVAALMSLFAVMSASAGAVTWHNTGDTAFTAGGNAGTFGVTGVNLACTGASATGTSPAGSSIGTSYNLATGTMSFSGCTLSGLPVTPHCTWAIVVTAVLAPEALGVVVWYCAVLSFGAEICKIEGQTPASYTNPTNPSTVGKVKLSHSSTLRTTNGSAGSCPLGVGEPVTLTAQTFTISSATGGPTTPHLGPRITRTA